MNKEQTLAAGVTLRSSDGHGVGWFGGNWDNLIGFTFDARGITQSSSSFSYYNGGLNEIVLAETVIDVQNREAWGVLHYIGGTYTTQKYSFATGINPCTLDAIYLWEDMRVSFLPDGLDIDNILVTESRIPEPVTLFMFGLGSLLLAYKRYRLSQ